MAPLFTELLANALCGRGVEVLDTSAVDASTIDNVGLPIIRDPDETVVGVTVETGFPLGEKKFDCDATPLLAALASDDTVKLELGSIELLGPATLGALSLGWDADIGSAGGVGVDVDVGGAGAGRVSVVVGGEPGAPAVCPHTK